MDCTALANCTGVATTPETERGLRFAEMLEAEPMRPVVYADAPARAESAGSALAGAMTQWQSLDFASQATSRADAVATPSAANPYESAAHEAVQAQAEILRTIMMMEVMNSAKQGVTTLFQQQG